MKVRFNDAERDSINALAQYNGMNRRRLVRALALSVGTAGDKE
ncbi:hypothetical protein R3J32_04410 [Xylella fastidiosa subsp. multiplex]